MNNYTKTTRKIGRNRGKPRLWIEGRALVEAGLPHGSAWILVNHIMGVDIVKVEAEPGSVFDGYRVRKIAGTTDRPVVDIAGSSLDPLVLFGEMPAIVDLEYAPEFGVIHVTRSTMNHPG